MCVNLDRFKWSEFLAVYALLKKLARQFISRAPPMDQLHKGSISNMISGWSTFRNKISSRIQVGWNAKHEIQRRVSKGQLQYSILHHLISQANSSHVMLKFIYRMLFLIRLVIGFTKRLHHIKINFLWMEAPHTGCLLDQIFCILGHCKILLENILDLC